MPIKPPQNQIHPRTRPAWRRWLARNHAGIAGIWLVYDKAATGKQELSYVDAVEEALCFGWIDSTVRGIDENCYMQYFAPRKPKSVWARTNKDRVARLIDEGAMQEAGLASVEVAKRNGAWEALDSVEAMEMPADLSAALREDPVAETNFAAFPASARKAYLYWINTAKGATTRDTRIAGVIALAAANQKSRHPSG